MSEHGEQAAFFDYVRWKSNSNSKYQNIFAIPNAGRRSYGALKYYLAEGLTPGIPDVFVAQPILNHSGMFIEFKSSTGKLSTNQSLHIAKLSSAGYLCVVARNATQAIDVLEKYLDGSLGKFGI